MSSESVAEVTGFHITENVEHGLRLPDGRVIWHPETFHGHPVNTPDARDTIAAAIATSAANLGVEVDYLLLRYRWATRRSVTYSTTTLVDGDDQMLLEPSMQASATDGMPSLGDTGF